MDAQVDRGLVEGMRRGTRGAREALYRGFHRRVFIYLSAIVVDPDTVWDLTHDVFVKVFECADRFDGEPATFTPWLLVIARNTAFDHLRTARRTDAEEPEAIDRRRTSDDPQPKPQWGDDEAVHHAVAGLPPQQRDVLTRRYRDDQSPDEIGRALGKSADAVRHIEQRALKTIRAQVPSGR